MIFMNEIFVKHKCEHFIRIRFLSIHGMNAYNMCVLTFACVMSLNAHVVIYIF